MTHTEVKEMRLALKLPQEKFWAAVGVVQSVGCRYEAGIPKIPAPVKLALVAHYGTATAPKKKPVRAAVRALDKALEALQEAREVVRGYE